MDEKAYTARKVEFEAARSERESTDFDAFLAEPVNKLALSMMPPSEPQELTVTLLRAAFHAGANCGVSCCTADLIGLLGRVFKDKK